MSYGLTIDDLVQQVYYTQEKVILDFEYWNDKYREVVMEANLVLQELQKEEDWLWLRERLVLGPMDSFGKPGEIPEFQLPGWVYKPATLHRDCVRLHRVDGCGDLKESGYIEVPWAPMGDAVSRQTSLYSNRGETLVPNRKLRAVNVGGTVTFTRVPYPNERHKRVAVTDVQRRIDLVPMPPRADVLRQTEKDAESEDRKVAKAAKQQIAEWERDFQTKRWFTEVPDPNYLVFRIAALHCVGSPVAQMRAQDLTDSAQKLLSAMREANAAATYPDEIEWSEFGFLEAV